MLRAVESWKLSFCAGYVVPSCKNLEPKVIQENVKGSPINVNSLPIEYFHSLFADSDKKCPIDILFVSENSTQQNAVRDLIRSIAVDTLDKKAKAAHELAYRLARATDKRSPSGLFIIIAGSANGLTRVVLWKFPSDESLQAKMSSEGLIIRLIKNAFSRKSHYFKAAMFEGTPATTAFWKGKVEDNQAKQRVPEASEFWIADFLKAQSALTDSRGTKILARTVQKIIKQKNLPMETKEAVVAAATVLKSQGDSDISMRVFADYLPEVLRSTFIKAAGGPEIADTTFKIDPITLENELKFKSIFLDNLFMVRGPLDKFDKVVKIKSTEHKDIVEISLRGKITSQTLGK